MTAERQDLCVGKVVQQVSMQSMRSQDFALPAERVDR
jgi:hypothetical protein